MRFWLGLILLFPASCVQGPDNERERPPAAPATAVTDAAPTAPAGDTVAALEIHFLDVGQGDAILLRSGGRSALIDAGPSDRIVRQLRALGVDSLALLLASHNHSDHIGGADAVLDSLPVRFYLDNGHPATTRIQERVLARVERRAITYLAPERRTLALGSARLRIIPAPEAADPEDQNNRSVAVLVEQGEFRALLTGDSELEELGALLRRDSLPDVDVLKAAHHGSRNGVSPAWLARTRPEVVVISLAAGSSYGHSDTQLSERTSAVRGSQEERRNRYGHPHRAALRLYCTGNRRVYRTDLHGEVAIRVDAEGRYSVVSERQVVPEELVCTRAGDELSD